MATRNTTRPSDLGIGVHTGPSPRIWEDLPSLDDPDEEYVRDHVLELIHYAVEEHERNWCADAYVFYRWFRNYIDSGFDIDSYASRVSSGLAYPFVKIISAKLMAVWQAGERILECTPVDAMGVSLAPRVESWVNNKIVNVIPRQFSKAELVKESAVALGRGVLKYFVDVQPQMNVFQKIMVKVGGIPVDRYLGWDTVPEEKRIDTDYVDPFNFGYCGSSRWFENCDFTWERSYLTESEVWRRIETKQYTRPFEVEASGKGYDRYTASRMQMESIEQFGQVRAGTRAPQPHQQIEVQGRIETRARENGRPKYEQRLVRIVNMEHMVNNEGLQTWNAKPSYIVFEPFQDHGALRPIGIIESIEQVLYAHNDFLNMILDNGRKIVDSTLLVDPSSTKQKTLYTGPNEINWVRNPTASVQPLIQADIPRGVFEMFGGLSDLMQRIIGINDFFAGMQTSNAKPLTNTARGMQLMAGLASDRFVPLLVKSGTEFYKKLGENLHGTGKQFLSDDGEQVRMSAMPGAPPSPSGDFTNILPADLDVAVKYSFKPRALDAAFSERQQQFVNMMKLLIEITQTPTAMQQGVALDIKEAARILMRRFDSESDGERIITLLPQMPMAPPGGPFATPGQPSMPGRPMPPAGAPPPGLGNIGMPQ